MGCFSERPKNHNRQEVDATQQEKIAAAPSQDQMLRMSQSLTGTNHAANLSKTLSQVQTQATFQQTIRKVGYNEATLHPYQSSQPRIMMTWVSTPIEHGDQQSHEEEEELSQSPRPGWQIPKKYNDIQFEDEKTLRVPSQQQLIRRKKQNEGRIQSQKRLKQQKC